MQWCDVGQIPSTTFWKESAASFENIRGKLEKERFGGSKLVDLRAKGLDHRNLLNLATSRRDRTPLSRAALDPLLESLMTTTLDPNERAVLIADLLAKRSQVIADEDLPQALEDAERSVKLMRDLPENAFRRDEQLVWSLGALASALRLAGRFEEAIPALRESLKLDSPSISFAIRLCELGVNYRLAGQPDEAIKSLKRSANILSRTNDGQDWTYTRQQRAHVLIILARTLESLDREKEAVPIRQEVVSMYRDLPRMDDDGHDLLILALINLAACAIPAKEYLVSQLASKEAIFLCKSDPENGDMLPMSLVLSSRASYAYEDVRSAIQDITAAINLQSDVEGLDAAEKRADWLMMRSKYLVKAGDALQGLQDVDAAISLYEAAHRQSADDSTVPTSLWEAYFSQASLLKELKRFSGALGAYQMAVKIRQPVVEAERDGSEEQFLELMSSLNGCAAVLMELNRLEEVKDYAKETIGHLRRRHRSSSSSTKISETLRRTLVRYVELIADLGDQVGALALASEAASISDQLEADQHQVSALMHKMMQEIGSGYPERAIVTAEACLELCETRLSDRRDLRHLALTSYARALDEAGRHAEAAERQEESLAIFRQLADFTTLDNKNELSQRLGKLAEYYQDARLFEKALVTINESTERRRMIYEDGEEDGMMYAQTLARKASILFSLNQRKEAQSALDHQLAILKTVLNDISVDDILELAGQRHHDALMHSAKGKSADALDCARQHVVLTRLAWSIEPRYSDEGDEDEDGAVEPKSILELALMRLGLVATMNGLELDAMAAMIEAYKLSHDVKLDIDELLMKKALENAKEEGST
ncbi:hypothetical protein DL93DRAFT_1857584 [Clavulina sp. PMI_390]|nr:hypothetical protein DL93DRAFT_1857584 [Clavulina sp. PMI_390]